MKKSREKQKKNSLIHPFVYGLNLIQGCGIIERINKIMYSLQLQKQSEQLMILKISLEDF